MLILFSKSKPPLVNIPVHVAGSVRKDGTVIKPHMRMQRVALESHEQQAHEHAAEPAEQKPLKLDAFLKKHGGEQRFRSTLMEMKPEQRAKLLDAMAHIDGLDPADVMARLGMHAKDFQQEPESKPEVPAAESAPEIVEHITRKGKTLRGVIRRDLTQEQAKQIDEYTFRKDGGWFIREKHLATAAKLDAARNAGVLTHEQHATARAAAAKDGPAGALEALKQPEAPSAPKKAADAAPAPEPAEKPMKNYGWGAVKLADAYSFDELNKLRAQVEAQHANPKDAQGHPLQNGKPTIHLYDKEGRRKLDKLAWAVTYKLQEQRRAAEQTPTAETGPKEGDTKVENGVEYVLRDGRWHRAHEEQPPAAQPAADGEPPAGPVAEPTPETAAEPAEQPEQADPDADLANDREELAAELARDPHSEAAKDAVRKVAHRVAARDEPVGTGAFDEDDPNSPNYRYADTGYVAGSRKEMAASQVIRRAKQEGARVFATAIDWDQLEENPREAKELITKSNLFGSVDWAALREGGMEPGAGFLIDRIYAAIGQEPSVDDAQARKDYTLGLQTLRDRLERAKTPADVTDVLDALREEYDGKILTAEESAQYQALGEEAQKLWEERRAIEAANDKLYQEHMRARGDMYEVQREVENRKRRGWAPKPDLDAKLAELKAIADAKDKEWGDTLRANKPRRDELDQQRRDLSIKRDAIVLAAKVRNKLENPLHRAWNIMGERFVNVLRYRSFKGSDAFAKHVTAAKTGKIADWSWAEKETVRAPRVTKESARFQMKVADAFERVGGRPVAPKSTAELKQMFGLRDVQSGNWVLRDVASAKFHTEHAAAAFADLADLMGAADEHVAMNGRLALAFGARGHGAKGWKDGAARAHYEAVQRVINLTKMGGGGTLAHEWFHALDNMAGEAEGSKTGVGDYFTENPDLLPEGELRDAAKALRSAMLDGPYQATRTETYTADDVKLAKRNIGGQFPNAIARMIVSAGNVHDAVQAIDRHFGTDGSKTVSPRVKRLAKDWRRIALGHYGGNPEGGEIAVRSGPKMSSFRLEAMKLDQGGKDYWAETHEMAARAFQAWVEDRLADQGRRNDYLSTLADNRYHVDPLFGIEWKPFPEGEERQRINAAFDRLVAAMQKSNTLAKALAMLDAA